MEHRRVDEGKQQGRKDRLEITQVDGQEVFTMSRDIVDVSVSPVDMWIKNNPLADLSDIPDDTLAIVEVSRAGVRLPLQFVTPSFIITMNGLRAGYTSNKEEEDGEKAMELDQADGTKDMEVGD